MFFVIVVGQLPSFSQHMRVREERIPSVQDSKRQSQTVGDWTRRLGRLQGHEGAGLGLALSWRRRGSCLNKRIGHRAHANTHPDCSQEKLKPSAQFFPLALAAYIAQSAFCSASAIDPGA